MNIILVECMYTINFEVDNDQVRYTHRRMYSQKSKEKRVMNHFLKSHSDRELLSLEILRIIYNQLNLKLNRF